MLFLHGLVRLHSRLSLQEVSALISERLCGGIPFVTTREFDEVPGVELLNKVMMLTIRICGVSPNFDIHIDTDASIYQETEFPQLEIINLSEYVERALDGIEQIQINPA